jgi:hypothetical protein
MNPMSDTGRLKEYMIQSKNMHIISNIPYSSALIGTGHY